MKKSEDCTKVQKTIYSDFPNIGKKLNMRHIEPQTATIKTEHLHVTLHSKYQKSNTGKLITYKGFRITADFSQHKHIKGKKIKNQKTKKQASLSEVFQTLKYNNFQTKLTCHTKLSFKIDGEIK